MSKSIVFFPNLNKKINNEIKDLVELKNKNLNIQFNKDNHYKALLKVLEKYSYEKKSL